MFVKSVELPGGRSGRVLGAGRRNPAQQGGLRGWGLGGLVPGDEGEVVARAFSSFVGNLRAQGAQHRPRKISLEIEPQPLPGREGQDLAPSISSSDSPWILGRASLTGHSL